MICTDSGCGEADGSALNEHMKDTTSYVEDIPQLQAIEGELYRLATTGNLKSVLFRVDDDIGRNTIVSADWYLMHVLEHSLLRLKALQLLQVDYPA